MRRYRFPAVSVEVPGGCSRRFNQTRGKVGVLHSPSPSGMTLIPALFAYGTGQAKNFKNNTTMMDETKNMQEVAQSASENKNLLQVSLPVYYRKWGSYGQHEAGILFVFKDDVIDIVTEDYLPNYLRYEETRMTPFNRGNYGAFVYLVTEIDVSQIKAVLHFMCRSSSSNDLYEYSVVYGDAKVIDRGHLGDYIIEFEGQRWRMNKCVSRVRFSVYDPHLGVVKEGNSLLLSGKYTFEFKDRIKNIAKSLRMEYKYWDRHKVWVVQGSEEQLELFTQKLSKYVELRWSSEGEDSGSCDDSSSCTSCES